jgi:2'-5' RNA ligase
MMRQADFAWADGLRRRWFPPERNQVPAHITLLRHLPPSREAEVRRMLACHARAAPPPARIDRLLDLGGGVALHVESPALQSIRAEIAERLHGLLLPPDQAEPRLHITIQNQVSRAEALKTLARLNHDFRPRAIGISGLACWHYQTGRWSPIARYSFHG